MNGKNIDFNEQKIKNSDFYKNKRLFKIDETDGEKIVVSRKQPYVTNKSIKYFIGYNDDIVRPLRIKLSQMIRYIKCFDSDKTMSFKVNVLQFNRYKI